MGQGFDVKPRALDVAAGDLHQMKVAIDKAEDFAATYIRRAWDGGVFLADAGSVVNDVESNIRYAYSRCGKDLERAGDALRSTADGYRESDRSAARAADKKIEKIGDIYDWDDDKPDYADTERGIRQSDVRTVLKDPGNRNDGIQDFLDIEEKVKKIIALGHEADEITALGFANPFVGWAEDWEGEWEKLGVAAAAMDTLGEFWNRLGGEVDATTSYLDQRWDGHASTQAQAWFNDAAHECYQHGAALQAMSDEVFYKGILMNDAVSSVLEVAADLVDLVTSVTQLLKEVGDLTDVFELIKHPLSIFSESYDVAKQALSALKKLEALVKHAGKIITLARGAFEVFFALIADWGSPSDSGVVQTPYFAKLDGLPGGGR